MCGISGIVNLKGHAIDENKLQGMNDAVAHRGPDASGVFIGKNFGLGHRRLSILDLSDRGTQPFTYMGLKIVYNGEIYNFLELKEELEKKRYQFKTGTDTEVILAAYHCWGKDCVNRFNGMWAFAIFDSARDLLFCSRDRFGVKPFYYLVAGDTLYFGSEIKQLLPYLPSRQVNKAVLFNYLYLSILNIDENTFFEGIKRLLPSHSLIVDLKTNHLHFERYYVLKAREEWNSRSFDDCVNEYGALISDSIKLRLRSDVKVGTCLSGGLDSSFIAAEASKIFHQKSNLKFTAITAQSIDKERDETAFAEKVAVKSELDHKIIAPGKKDFYDALDEVIKTQEEPFGSPSIIMQYYVMKAARSFQSVVMLDGQGGDETLLGYERYYISFLRDLPWYGKLRQARSIVQNSKLSWFDLVKSYFYFSIPQLKIRLAKNRQSYIRPEFAKCVNWDFVKEKYAASKDSKSLQIHEITRDQLTTLLNYEDKNSMKFAIETRLPYLDYRVVELAVSIPAQHKINGGWTKFILRKISETTLPGDISWRRNKFGFEAPLETWLGESGELLKEIGQSKFIAEFVDASKLERITDKLVLWRLYNVAKWASLFEVKF